MQLLEEYEYGMESIRQKSRDTAKMMRVASNKTEPLIKYVSFHLILMEISNTAHCFFGIP